MIKTSRTIATGMIISILLMCVFAVFTPVATAGPFDKQLEKLYRCDYDLKVEYDKEKAESPFLPVDKTIEIPITLKLRFYGRYAEEIEPFYSVAALVELHVNNTPSWATATIVPPFLTIPASAEYVDVNATVNIKVDENAIPFKDGKIEIRIDIGKLGAIQKRTFSRYITFWPGYLPVLDISTSETVKQIKPQDTVNLDIEIDNLGNAKTNLLCKVLDLPEGWVAEIPSNVVLGSGTLGEDTSEIVSLDVKPPYDFGYHNEREIIKVSITPLYYGNESIKGEEHFVSFIIQSRGFSTPGFEGVFVFFAFMCIAMIFKKRRKNRDNTHRFLETDKRGEF